MSAGNKVLGIAVGQKSLLLAEVVAKGERYAVSHCAEFVFPEGQSLSTPDKLGESLRQFMKTRQIQTREVVIGLPAKRLVTRRKDVPPATLEVAASTLRLQAEGEFSSELDNLIMDYAGTPSTREPTTVLIIATNRTLVDECEEMAKAAGLRVVAVTSTTAALGRTTSRLPGGDGLVLSIGPNGAELVIQHGVNPMQLKHLNVIAGAEAMTALAGEIRRTMASIPRNGTPQTLAVWSTGEENQRSVLEQRLSIPVTMPEISNLVLTETPNTEGFAPAVSLALAAMQPEGLPVDFLHSRLAPPKAPSISDAKKLAIAACVLFAAGIGFAAFDLMKLGSDLDRKQQANGNAKKNVDQANMDIGHETFVEGWFPKNKVNLNVLRALTSHFPSGRTIWVTNMSAHENSWTMAGKAMREDYIKSKVAPVENAPVDTSRSTGVVDQMLEDPRFQYVSWKMNFEENTGLWSFNVTFLYTGDESAAPEVTVAADQPATGGLQSNGFGGAGGVGGQGIQGGRGGRGGGGQGGPGGAGFGGQGGGGRGGRGGGGFGGGGAGGGFGGAGGAAGAGGFGGGPGGGGFGGAGGFGGGPGGGGFGGAGGGFGGAGGAGAGGVDPGAVDPGAVDPGAGTN